MSHHNTRHFAINTLHRLYQSVIASLHQVHKNLRRSGGPVRPLTSLLLCTSDEGRILRNFGSPEWMNCSKSSKGLAVGTSLQNHRELITPDHQTGWSSPLPKAHPLPTDSCQWFTGAIWLVWRPVLSIIEQLSIWIAQGQCQGTAWWWASKTFPISTTGFPDLDCSLINACLRVKIGHQIVASRALFPITTTIKLQVKYSYTMALYKLEHNIIIKWILFVCVVGVWSDWYVQWMWQTV